MCSEHVAVVQVIAWVFNAQLCERSARVRSGISCLATHTKCSGLHWNQPLCASVWSFCHTACEGKPIALRSHGQKDHRGTVVGSIQVWSNCMHAQLDEVTNGMASAEQVSFLAGRLH